MDNIFEQAFRLKLRFDSPKGQLTVEDLWDVPLTSATGKANLDDIARSLNKLIKECADEVSFVTPTAPSANVDLRLGFEIVKYVIGVRVKERDEAKQAEDRKAKKQQLMALIDRKVNMELEGKSLEELRSMVDAL